MITAKEGIRIAQEMLSVLGDPKGEQEVADRYPHLTTDDWVEVGMMVHTLGRRRKREGSV